MNLSNTCINEKELQLKIQSNSITDCIKPVQQ